MQASRTATWRLIFRSLRMDGPQTTAALLKNLGPIIPRCSMAAMKRWLTLWYVGGWLEKNHKTWRLSAKGCTAVQPKVRQPMKTRPRRPTKWAKIDPPELDDLV